MKRILEILLIGLFVTGCKPTYRDYSEEHDRVFQGYATGDVVTARESLLEDERVITKYEMARTSMDAKAARRVLYARLCAVSLHMGLTNDAHTYFEKVTGLKEDTNVIAQAEVVAAIERSDHQLQPRWRQKK